MINRREFLERVARWTAGAAAIPVVHVGSGWARAAEESRPLVSVVEGKDWAGLAARVLEPLGGMKAFVKPGAKVVVKPNIAWDRSPELAGNTHPEVVKAIVKLALEAGAAEVKVWDRSCNDERRCYVSSGIQAAVESLASPKVKCFFADERRYVPVKIARGASLKKWEFYRDALEADVYVNVPIAKHHGSAGLTLGLKNVMGVIGGSRGVIHWALDERIADLNLVVKPTVTVIDATRILLRNGPRGGNIEDVKVCDTLVASVDTVAVDAWSTKHLFGLEPSEIGSTVAGAKLGLGQMDLAKMKIVTA